MRLLKLLAILSILHLDPVGKVTYKPLDEMSGIVQSSRDKNIYWTHNDSGDTARIFAIKLDGTVVMPPGSQDYQGIAIDGAKNVDWEDITREDKTLYIDDMGNNNNKRKDLCIYVVQEPDPTRDTHAKLIKRIPVAYPDQKAFPPDHWLYDCESIFLFKHKIYMLTKQRTAPIHLPLDGTVLYRLDTMDTTKTNVLTRVDEKNNLGGWVTSAALSPNGKTLAVLCHYPQSSVWLFDTPKTGDKFLSSKSRRIQFTGAQQCEGICFIDADHVAINEEQREIFTLAIR